MISSNKLIFENVVASVIQISNGPESPKLKCWITLATSQYRNRPNENWERKVCKFANNVLLVGENGVRWANFTKTFLKYTKFKSLKFLSLQIIQIHSFAIYILQNLRNVITFCGRNVRLKFFGKMAQLTPHTGKVDPPSGGKLIHL